jgi:hypothetical protein
MLPEELIIRSMDGILNKSIPFSLSRQAGSGKITDEIGDDGPLLFFRHPNILVNWF